MASFWLDFIRNFDLVVEFHIYQEHIAISPGIAPEKRQVGGIVAVLSRVVAGLWFKELNSALIDIKLIGIFENLILRVGKLYDVFIIFACVEICSTDFDINFYFPMVWTYKPLPFLTIC